MAAQSRRTRCRDGPKSTLALCRDSGSSSAATSSVPTGDDFSSSGCPPTRPYTPVPSRARVGRAYWAAEYWHRRSGSGMICGACGFVASLRSVGGRPGAGRGGLCCRGASLLCFARSAVLARRTWLRSAGATAAACARARLRSACGFDAATGADGRDNNSGRAATAERLGHRRRRLHAVALRADANRRALAQGASASLGHRAEADCGCGLVACEVESETEAGAGSALSGWLLIESRACVYNGTGREKAARNSNVAVAF